MGSRKILDSIAFRISISITIVVAVATITVGWLILIEEKKTLEAELHNKSKYLVELIANQMIEPLLNEDYPRIDSLIKSSMKSEESLIVYFEVYNRNKELIAKTYKNNTFHKIVLLPFVFENFALHINDDNKMPFFHLSLPVNEKAAGIIGFLRISITKEFLYRTLKNIRQKLFILAAAVIFISVALGLWMARRVLKPVLILNNGVQKIEDGEVGVEIPVVGKGEIKELALSFNKMSLKLKNHFDAAKAAQNNLIKTEKLYAIGEFSAGIAHEIRNPLTSIKMLMQAVEKKNQPLSPKQFNIIQGEITRIDNIITEFLAFTRPGKTDKTDVYINEILEEVVIITKPQMERSGIRLKEKLTSALPIIKGNHDALKQVFINIVLNALQAMEEAGGTLSIKTSTQNGNLSTVIKDTGVGISEKNLSNICNPFFTTKEKGTGMGLAVTSSIISDHSGKINIVSIPKIGTIITVELPL